MLKNKKIAVGFDALFLEANERWKYSPKKLNFCQPNWQAYHGVAKIRALLDFRIVNPMLIAQQDKAKTLYRSINERYDHPTLR